MPVGIVAVILGLLFLKDTERDQNSKTFGVPGIVLLSGSLFLLVWAPIKAPDYGWGDAKTLGFLGATLVVGLLLVPGERRRRSRFCRCGCSAPCPCLRAPY